MARNRGQDPNPAFNTLPEIDCTIDTIEQYINKLRSS